MSNQTITLKTVNDLRLDASGEAQRYFIASYQRGYRWSALQVTQLLEDILEFTRRRDPQPEEFYCLQPLVLKVSIGGGYEVVDGQQRLTTLLLILRHFNERLAEKYRQQIFTLDYETRPNLLGFLNQPTESLANSNVDFFHLFGAVKTIEKWFSEKDNEVDEIKSAVLNKTKVIWFQLSERDSAVDAFTRLNVGKIPLTNDELIRALFLKRSDEKESEAAALQLRIAHEWDQLEKALQADAFWYFLSNQPGPRQNRIGFLFELVAKADGMPSAGDDGYGIFYAYSKKLKDDRIAPDLEWLKIKQTYMTLEEWFEDRTLYHIVGFLIQQGVGVDNIQSLSEQVTKSNFEQKLREEVFVKVIKESALNTLNVDELREKISETLDDLDYGIDAHKSRIRSILLLFNLATLLDSPQSNLRFQFDSFKRENWDIEHVRSVASGRPMRHHDRVEWLERCLGYLETQETEAELCSEIDKFVILSQKDALDTVFDGLYERVLGVFKESDEDVDNGISNLTLLDQNTNRSYKNAVFAVKRQRLLSLDQSGIFVPLCTRNVFLKCYSPQVDNVMFWSNDDRQAYRAVIIETLVRFFGGNQEISI
jgi:hypothetical protein